MTHEKRPLPRSKNCFVCGIHNERGFQLKFSLQEGQVSSHVIIPEDLIGYDGMAHGGILATLLDEVMGWAANCHVRGATTTGELTVRYRNPAPVGQKILLEGHVVKSRGLLCYTEGCLSSPTGEIFAQGKGKFMGRPDISAETLAFGLVHEPGDARIFEESP